MPITATRWSATRIAADAPPTPREQPSDLPAPAGGGESDPLVEGEFLGMAGPCGRLLRALREG